MSSNSPSGQLGFVERRPGRPAQEQPKERTLHPLLLFLCLPPISFFYGAQTSSGQGRGGVCEDFSGFIVNSVHKKLRGQFLQQEDDTLKIVIFKMGGRGRKEPGVGGRVRRGAPGGAAALRLRSLERWLHFTAI